jgi:dTDP-4-dehydrorhamnose reductase
MKRTELDFQYPEMWAGLECTVNRVHDQYFDQCDRNGHDQRLQDLELFSELGIKKLRYPALWEKACPGSTRTPEWALIDRQFNKMKELGLCPIAGLLHHGSGPRFTHLLDPAFPRLFAEYARAFAQRFPWVELYTPINEPLTTARFSALYGFWYPHHRSDRDFLRALLNQTQATRLAMKEIRKINPSARLVQTEDLGRATSTPPLRYQAMFENQRRWLSLDLLSGNVSDLHPLWTYLLRNGISETELKKLSDFPCPPDIIGLNHYLLSNRFLDHRLDRYPAAFHGGNGIDVYADVPTVDWRPADAPKPGALFKECWQRFATPIAVTEVHLAGPRESQMRWLHEIWETAGKLRREGIDITAVTAWSLLGSFEWNSLCTRRNNFYESGVFSVHGSIPRPTHLVKMISGLAKEGRYQMQLLQYEKIRCSLRVPKEHWPLHFDGSVRPGIFRVGSSRGRKWTSPILPQ